MKEFNLDEYLKDPSQKVVTRDGREVRIICTDRKGEQPIIALVTINTKEDVRCFYKNGRWSNTNEWYLDLFFAPIKREGWVNVFKSQEGNIIMGVRVFATKGKAEEFKNNSGYLDTIKIEWEE